MSRRESGGTLLSPALQPQTARLKFSRISRSLVIRGSPRSAAWLTISRSKGSRVQDWSSATSTLPERQVTDGKADFSFQGSDDGCGRFSGALNLE